LPAGRYTLICRVGDKQAKLLLVVP